MKVFKSVIASLCVFTSLPALAAPLHGGHDGGGANLWTVSAAEVKSAIQWAMDDLKSSKHPGWLFWAIPYGPKFQRDDGKVIGVIECLQTSILCQSPQEFERKIYQGEKIPMSPWDLLNASPLELKEDGPCPAPDKNHAAGSVSEFKIGAKLCLSVSELSRSTPSGLKAEVASVLAHEMAHLMGFGEDIAVQVQEAIVDHFGRITHTDGSPLVNLMMGTMLSMDSALENSANFSKNGARAMAGYFLGYANGQAELAQDMLPSAFNNLLVPVAKPELAKQVNDAFGAIRNRIFGLASKLDQFSDAQVLQEIAAIRAQQRELGDLLAAYLGAPPIQHFN